MWWWLLPHRCVLCCVWPHPLPQISELASPLCELTWVREEQAPILLYTLIKLNHFREDPAGAAAKHWQTLDSHSWLPWGGQVSWDDASSSRLELSTMKQCNVFVIQERDLTPTPSFTLPVLPAELIHLSPSADTDGLFYLAAVREP